MQWLYNKWFIIFRISSAWFTYFTTSLYILVLFVSVILSYHWISFHKVIDITYITYRIRNYMIQYKFKDNDFKQSWSLLEQLSDD